MKKDNRTRKQEKRKRRKYKKYIYSLCRRVIGGDSLAEAELNSELKKNRLANWSVKHWLKVKKIPLTELPEKEILSSEDQSQKRRFQQMGFHEGAAVAGSNLRKITK